MARLPLPGPQLTAGRITPPIDQAAVPAGVRAVAGALRAAGHEAHLVGGCVRDLLRGVAPVDWDLTTNARPEAVQALFPGALHENRFGTVVVRTGDGDHEVTTWRRETTYSDHRRPDAVEPADSLQSDLARRDFTVNAMAIAVDEGGLRGGDLRAALLDPFGGQDDLRANRLRAVGVPADRFREDALRMLRAVRFAATLEMTLDEATEAAIAAAAPLAAHISGERVAAELAKLLGASRPSRGLRLAQTTGLLDVIAPELARQPGIPQAKIPGDDLWDHTVRTVDAASLPGASHQGGIPGLRLAALVHDIGKPATFADGHFIGHDIVGAELAATWLATLHVPHALVERTAHLVRQHMFAYDAGWSDTAVRRFIRRVGVDALEDLLDLRAADNVGSGQAPDVHGVEELRTRCRVQLAARVALGLRDLAVNGSDLMSSLRIPEGPRVGALLERLLERVIADPMRNDRSLLISLARELMAENAPVPAPLEGHERA